MEDFLRFQESLECEKQEFMKMTNSSNPLSVSLNNSNNNTLSEYKQSIPRHSYDEDLEEILAVIRILNNMAPLRMPVYNFKTDEINGESYFLPDGTLLFIREDDGDVLRDYYVSSKDKSLVDRILEHDKSSGRLRVKIEPLKRNHSHLKTNLIIFDEKINKKYTLMQLTEEGYVNNITEFSGVGKSFKTLFRNSETLKPARYLEGKDNKDKDFEMIDCIIDLSGNIARIRRYNSKKEINIEYTETSKQITYKTKKE
jgi:hypothetical protein